MGLKIFAKPSCPELDREFTLLPNIKGKYLMQGGIL
jgi:hypothetical protein